MIRKILCFALVVAVSGFIACPVTAKSKAQSPLLKNPKKCVNLIADHADFYALAKDEENGGFYSYLDREGNPIYPDEYDADEFWYWHWYEIDPEHWLQWMEPYSEFSHHLKGVTAQSRAAYMFVRAFQTTGDETYLDLAKHALDFLYEHGWDYEYDGWRFTLDEHGNLAPLMPGNWWDPNYFKWTYQQIYPLVGIAAMVEATGGTREVIPFPESGMDVSTDNDWLMEAFEVVDDYMWDTRPELEGFFMYSSNVIDDGVMWADPNGKSFTGVVDSITTHASQLHLMTGEAFFTERFEALGNQAVSRIATSFGHNPWGFVTEYDSDWAPADDPLNGSVSVGHMLKTAWVLARTYLETGNADEKEAAAQIIEYVLDNGGYDEENGAPFDSVSWATPLDDDGVPIPDEETTVTIDQIKGHWSTEQGVTAGLLNYAISDDPDDKAEYLAMADSSLDFFEKHFIDHEYGGSFFYTDVEGNVINEVAKSDWGETGYHTTELLYYTYLYGKLLYKNSSVRLYYYFDPHPEARSIQLNPIEGCDNRIVIKNVKLNGKKYHDFNRKSRTLHIPAGVGGKFRVKFKNAAPSCG